MECDLMRFSMMAPTALLLFAALAAPAQAQRRGAPESFTANLQAAGATGGAGAATIQIDVQKYSADADRAAVESALKSGGYPAFLAALKKAPAVGTVVFGEQKWSIRWARELTTPKGRSIVVVTDQPVFFVGGGRVDAKPRAGYDVAVIQMTIDDVGLGNGSMAAAANVKAGGESGVEINDYADKPIKLVSVVRKF
jgi:hypothetical protein